MAPSCSIVVAKNSRHVSSSQICWRARIGVTQQGRMTTLDPWALEDSWTARQRLRMVASCQWLRDFGSANPQDNAAAFGGWRERFRAPRRSCKGLLRWLYWIHPSAHRTTTRIFFSHLSLTQTCTDYKTAWISLRHRSYRSTCRRLSRLKRVSNLPRPTY